MKGWRWLPVNREYHSHGYRIIPGIRGWNVWKANPMKCLERDLASLREAKMLAAMHSEVGA